MLNFSNDVIDRLQTYYYCATLSETVIFEARARESGRGKTETWHGNEEWGPGTRKNRLTEHFHKEHCLKEH